MIFIITMEKKNYIQLLIIAVLLLGFASCSNNVSYGSIAFCFPGRNRASESEFLYRISLDGPSSRKIEAFSGETIVVDNLYAGKYKIDCQVYEKGTDYFYGDGQACAEVEAGRTAKVSLPIKQKWLPPVITAQPYIMGSVVGIGAERKQKGVLCFEWYACDSDGKVGDFVGNGSSTGSPNATFAACSLSFKNLSYDFVICKVMLKENDNAEPLSEAWSNVVQIAEN